MQKFTKLRTLRESGEGQSYANTILSWLGGQRALKQLNAFDVYYDEDGSLFFRFRLKADNKANCCHVKPRSGLYVDLILGKYLGPEDYRIIEKIEDIHQNEIVGEFEKATGIYMNW